MKYEHDTVPEYIELLRKHGFNELVDVLLEERTYKRTSSNLNLSQMCRRLGCTAPAGKILLAKARQILVQNDMTL